ncbi:hypothetical protein Pogu_1498 [Pyrobaculum oguniense TE7]|uniref:Uncharacterized protein n=1 Tax=Pyrobaculum oguniense (strain DSM 13380 / JCM 10595 / TE7) TaxID=698757 RepID=H6QC53_PYROT|nr:hypothetical protein Pogu_1498 [Pyrobaculum oguniense TE7]
MLLNSRLTLRICAPEYYVYTLTEWIKYIRPTLEELGVSVDVSVDRCGSVVLEICGRTYEGLPDNEGALLELILSVAEKCGNRLDARG